MRSASARMAESLALSSACSRVEARLRSVPGRRSLRHPPASRPFRCEIWKRRSACATSFRQPILQREHALLGLCPSLQQRREARLLAQPVRDVAFEGSARGQQPSRRQMQRVGLSLELRAQDFVLLRSARFIECERVDRGADAQLRRARGVVTLDRRHVDLDDGFAKRLGFTDQLGRRYRRFHRAGRVGIKYSDW